MWHLKFHTSRRKKQTPGGLDRRRPSSLFQHGASPEDDIAAEVSLIVALASYRNLRRVSPRLSSGDHLLKFEPHQSKTRVSVSSRQSDSASVPRSLVIEFGTAEPPLGHRSAPSPST